MNVMKVLDEARYCLALDNRTVIAKSLHEVQLKIALLQYAASELLESENDYTRKMLINALKPFTGHTDTSAPSPSGASLEALIPVSQVGGD